MKEARRDEIETMPKTKEIVVGDTTYTVREAPSGQIVNWFMYQMRKVARLDQDSDAFQVEQERVQHELAKRMVLSPVLDDARFTGDDYTVDDVKLELMLMREVSSVFDGFMEEVTDQQKKN